MTTRTFRLRGQAYGTSPVSIQAKIDGTVVYSGPVPTDSSNPPVLPDLDLTVGEPLFSWTAPVEYAGTFDLEIAETAPDADTTFLYITGTDANYIAIPDPDNPGKWMSGGAGVYGENFEESHTDEQGEWICGQMITDVDIDGVAIDIHSTRDLSGQFFIRILPDQVMTATLHTQAGIAPPPPTPV